MADAKPKVGVVMGSKSDWPTMEHAVTTLEKLGIEPVVRVLSAHRTPDAAHQFATSAEKEGLEAIIAGAGGAAHLAGVMAGNTHIPVLGCPMTSKLDGLDSLLSTAQMPRGIPVATFAIAEAGCVNAALFAAAFLALKYPGVRDSLLSYRKAQTEKVLAIGDPRS